MTLHRRASRAGRSSIALCAFTVATVAAAQTASAPEVETTATPPTPPGARQLCDEHVRANVGEVHWQLHALTQTPAAVVTSYVRTYGAPPTRGDGQHLLVRGPSNLIHEIYPVSEMAQRPHCAQNPRPGESTLVLISVLHAAPR